MTYDPKTIREDCGYNKIFQYEYCLHAHGVPGNLIDEMVQKCDHRFGWHFVAHDNMDYYSEDWYEDQTAYISFEDKLDLVNVVLSSKTLTL